MKKIFNPLQFLYMLIGLMGSFVTGYTLREFDSAVEYAALAVLVLLLFVGIPYLVVSSEGLDLGRKK